MGLGLSVLVGNTDALNDHWTPHGGEDAVNVVLLEIFYIRDASDVAEPEVFDHLVHGGVSVRLDLVRFSPGERLIGSCLRKIISQAGHFLPFLP